MEALYGRLKALSTLSVLLFVLLLPGRAISQEQQILRANGHYFSPRDAIIIHTEGGVGVPEEVLILDEGKALKVPFPNTSLSKSFKTEFDDLHFVTQMEAAYYPKDNHTTLIVRMKTGYKVSSGSYRLTNYEVDTILLELFPLGVKPKDVPLPGGAQLGLARLDSGQDTSVENPREETGPTAAGEEFVFHFRGARSLLVDQLVEAGFLKGPVVRYVADGKGEVTTPDPYGNQVRSIAKLSAPDVIVLEGYDGDEQKIADLLKTIPLTADSKRTSKVIPPDSRGTFDSDYPDIATSPSAYRYTLAGDGSQVRPRLSNVLVTLDASDGKNVFDVLNLLSSISGISIVIDPYVLDDPRGGVYGRDALAEFPPEEERSLGGFRPAGDFGPGAVRRGTFYGTFVDVPFDLALDIVLKSNNLDKVVFQDSSDPYSNPVIYVSSRERLEEETEAVGGITVYQPHYAESSQIYFMLGNMDLLPSMNFGYYGYAGFVGFGGGFGGGRAGGGGGAGQGGGGGRVGGGGGGGAPPFGTAVDLDSYELSSSRGVTVIKGDKGKVERFLERESRGAALVTGKRIRIVLEDVPGPEMSLVLSRLR